MDVAPAVFIRFPILFTEKRDETKDNMKPVHIPKPTTSTEDMDMGSHDRLCVPASSPDVRPSAIFNVVCSDLISTFA